MTPSEPDAKLEAEAAAATALHLQDWTLDHIARCRHGAHESDDEEEEEIKKEERMDCLVALFVLPPRQPQSSTGMHRNSRSDAANRPTCCRRLLFGLDVLFPSFLTGLLPYFMAKEGRSENLEHEARLATVDLDLSFRLVPS
jgi:hypothetical protein